MQQTEKLKLNLIETGDPISPAPINQNTQALDGLVAGIAAEQHLIYLGETALNTNGSTLIVDLSGVNVAQYDGLFLLCHFIGYTSSIQMYVNNSSNVQVAQAAVSGPTYTVGVTEIRLYPLESTETLMFCRSIGHNRKKSGYGTWSGELDIQVPWNEISTIRFTPKMDAGTHVRVYGLKR